MHVFFHEFSYCLGTSIASSITQTMSVLRRGVLGLHDHSAWYLGGVGPEVSPRDYWGRERDSRGKIHHVLLRQNLHPVGASGTILSQSGIQQTGLMVEQIQAGEDEVRALTLVNYAKSRG